MYISLYLRWGNSPVMAICKGILLIGKVEESCQGDLERYSGHCNYSDFILRKVFHNYFKQMDTNRSVTSVNKLTRLLQKTHFEKTRNLGHKQYNTNDFYHFIIQ